ncbi:MAG: MFS transporter [Hyphomonas sp.]
MTSSPENRSTKLLYGLGQAAEGIKTATFAIFLIFYYNQVLGLSGSLSGLAVGIAIIFDAITDPLIGSLSDRWKSRLGRRHPFMYASIIPFCLTIFLLFSPPQGMSEFNLFIWLTVFAVLTRSAMTLFYVPHIALGAELSSDFDERTSIVSYRFFFGTIGMLVAIGLGFGVFLADTENGQGLFDPGQYSLMAGALAVVMFFVMITCALGTQKRASTLYEPSAEKPTGRLSGLPVQLAKDLLSALSNYSFRGLFFGLLVTAIMIGVDNSLSLHMNSFFWELTSEQNTVFFVANPIGILIGVMLTRWLGVMFGKKPLIIWGTGGWLFFQITPIVLRFAGMVPENGAPELLWVLVSSKFLQGLFLAQILVSLHSMIADIVDEHQLESGQRNEGIFFAAIGFSGKATSGLGSFASGVALDLIAWPKGAAIRSASDVPPDTIAALGLLYGPGIAVFGIVSMWCYSRHSLDRNRYREIQEELQRRQQAAENLVV